MLIYCNNYPALAFLRSHEGPMSQTCHCWIMQSSLWLCLSSRAPHWKAAPVPSLFVDPFIFHFLSKGKKKKYSTWLCVRAELKLNALCLGNRACCASSLHHSLLSDTVCSADMASAPSHLALARRQSLTTGWSSKGEPTLRYLLPVSHAEPRRQKIKFNKKRECCLELDEIEGMILCRWNTDNVLTETVFNVDLSHHGQYT